MVLRASLVALLVSVGMASCGGSEAPPAKSKAAKPEQQGSLRTRMHTGFVSLSEAKTAVIEGKLKDAKQAGAKVWVGHQGDDVPADWAPFVSAIRSSIDLLQSSTELETAALAVSAIGRACGDCHQSLGLSTIPTSEEPAPPAGTVGDYMRLHQWASDRMWDGLIGPSDTSWNAGAQALATPLSPDSIPETIMVKPGMDALVERIGQLSKAAAEPNLPGPTRQRIYGEFLGSCARCHQTFLEGTD